MEAHQLTNQGRDEHTKIQSDRQKNTLKIRQTNLRTDRKIIRKSAL